MFTTWKSQSSHLRWLYNYSNPKRSPRDVHQLSYHKSATVPMKSAWSLVKNPLDHRPPTKTLPILKSPNYHGANWPYSWFRAQGLPWLITYSWFINVPLPMYSRCLIYNWLVVWNMNGLFFHSVGNVNPSQLSFK